MLGDERPVADGFPVKPSFPVDFFHALGFRADGRGQGQVEAAFMHQVDSACVEVENEPDFSRWLLPAFP